MGQRFGRAPEQLIPHRKGREVFRSDIQLAQAPHRHVQVKASEEKLQGAYSNHMIVAHSKEEFYLDFMVMLLGLK